MPIDFYYMETSAPCRSVMLTAEALNVQLNLIELNLMQQEHLTPEFIKINPQHTIPTMVDDGFSLWESRSIMRYLVNKYGEDSTLYPKDPKARAVVDQRLDFDMGTLYQRYAQYYYPQIMEGAPANEGALKKLQEALEFLDVFLQGNKYVAGPELTIADLAIVATVSTIESSATSISGYPNIVKWYDLVKTTIPKYVEINQKGLDKMKHLLAQFAANRK